jgi:hypothetical protein
MVKTDEQCKEKSRKNTSIIGACIMSIRQNKSKYSLSIRSKVTHSTTQ